MSADSERRFTYEFITYGDPVFPDADYETLEDAVEDMATAGWRFVETVGEEHAIFEKPADGGGRR